MPTTLRRALAGAALLAVLAGCGQEAAPAPAGPTPSADTAPHEGAEEVEELAPRVLVGHDGGFLVLDSASGEVLDDVPLAGVSGLSPSLDGRHVLVATPEGHHVYDSGVEAEAHGDHAHYVLRPAGLTGDVVAGAGPAVTNAGNTAVVGEDGEVLVLGHHLLGNGVPTVHTWTAARSDTGLVVPLAEGGMLVARGTAGAAEVALFDDGGAEVAAAPCPDPAGAQGAAGGAVVVGCADGPLVLRDGALTRPTAEETPGTAVLAGSPLSAVVLGGYAPGPDGAAPQRLSLVDTAAGSVRTVGLEAGYGPRSLARGPYGEALVLTTDGVLRAVDDLSGEQLGQVTVGGAWSGQEPAPVLVAVEGFAYVADPAARALHVVDLLSGQVVHSHDLPHVPLDLTVVTGLPPAEG